jgi:glucose-6-phosphate-specific signal transduction histidine kinase
MVHTEVINDGYRDHGQEREGERGRTSSGLAGLADRVTVHGGQMEAGPLPIDGTAGFRVWVKLPIRSSGTIERERQA